jgi:hypothetical protein
VPVPGEVNVPTGVIVVVSCGAGTGVTPTVIVCVSKLDDCWSGVPADTVTGIELLAFGATDVVTVTVG